jgi:hypothetical protein
VLEALHNGELTLEEASRRYALSVEELRAWERDFERYGVHGPTRDAVEDLSGREAAQTRS